MRDPALLLLLLLLPLLLQPSRSEAACRSLACFVDYLQTLSCTWDGAPPAEPQRLSAAWADGPGGFCDLLPAFRNGSHARYTCKAEQKLCVSRDTFAVRVPKLSRGAPAAPRECGPFRCHENVKPQPPFNLTATASPGGYNLSWESGYPANDYLNGQLQYQLRYRQKGRAWSPAGGPAGGQKLVLQDTPTLWLLPQELEGGMEYELQVRAGLMDSSHYKGTWSDWSPPSSLRTPPRGPAGARWVVMPLLAFSVLVTLVAFLCKQQRPWKKLEQFIPSPAPFFQTLYLVHNGDFKTWAGTSHWQAPLDVHECGTALPEVFRMSPAKPLVMTATTEEASAPHCTASPPAFPEEGPGPRPELAYGHLSIDTVTVADACGSEPDYRCLPWDSSPLESLLLFGETNPPRDTGSSGPRCEDACLAPLEARALLEHRGPLYGLLPQRGPVGASSPPSTKPFCREPLSPTWATGGDLGDGLDLDTLDSGFADSDCGSPVDCEFRGRRASCAAPGEGEEEDGEEDGATFLPSYVKQWVTCHAPLAEHS